MGSIVRNRSLQPEEVEIRLDTIAKSDKSFTVVPYIKKETAWSYMDELFGADNWDKTVTVDKKSADTPFYSICRITVHDGGSGFYREDAGEGDTPKAAASDALKRAAMNIVPSFRALGTVPTLRIFRKDVEDLLDDKGQSLKDALRFMRFRVSSISFGTGVSGDFVKSLSIVEEETGSTVYEYVSNRREFKTELSGEAEKRIADIRVKLRNTYMSEENFLKIYGAKDLSDIVTVENLYNDAIINLEGRQKEVDARMAKIKAKPQSAAAAPAGKGKKTAAKKEG